MSFSGASNLASSAPWSPSKIATALQITARWFGNKRLGEVSATVVSSFDASCPILWLTYHVYKMTMKK